MPIVEGRFWRAWMDIAAHIGDFQARLLLTAFYFTVAMPVGLLLTLGGDPLQIRRQAGQPRWLARPLEAQADLGRARRQY